MSNLSNLSSIPTDKLIQLHQDVVDASIAFEGKGNYKRIFEQRRTESTGKLKKIYSALKKARREDINGMVGLLIELLPNGYKKQ